MAETQDKHMQNTSKYTRKTISNFLFLLNYTCNTRKRTPLIRKRSSIYSIYGITKNRNISIRYLYIGIEPYLFFMFCMCLSIISKSYKDFACVSTCVLPVQRFFRGLSSASKNHAIKTREHPGPGYDFEKGR